WNRWMDRFALEDIDRDGRRISLHEQRDSSKKVDRTPTRFRLAQHTLELERGTGDRHLVGIRNRRIGIAGPHQSGGEGFIDRAVFLVSKEYQCESDNGGAANR